MNKQNILFIGDSITEWGRFEDPENIGINYVRYIRDDLQSKYSANPPEIINKGIGGNRITDLAERWEEDAISFQPDIISISIGINDVWRQLDNPGMKQVCPEEFKRIYKKLLEKVRKETKAAIVLMEPTIIEEKIHSSGNEMLKDYVAMVQKLAVEFEAVLVPTHQDFIRYLEENDGRELTTDGVHMNEMGNRLMAESWIKATKGLFL